MSDNIETPESKEQADGLVSDYKKRLGPYVEAMKSRGYFGEAQKLQMQQQKQLQDQSEMTAGETQKKVTSTQPAMTGADPVNTTPQKPGSMNPQSVDQPDGDYLSVGKEVKPDDSDESNASDITAGVKPKPVGTNGGMTRPMP